MQQALYLPYLQLLAVTQQSAVDSTADLGLITLYAVLAAHSQPDIPAEYLSNTYNSVLESHAHDLHSLLDLDYVLASFAAWPCARL